MQLVVVMAVRKAVSAATTIFTAISISRAFFIVLQFLGARCKEQGARDLLIGVTSHPSPLVLPLWGS